MNPSRPHLRGLDIRPTLHQRRPSLLLRDPLELAEQYLILPQALGPALMLCDGEHDLAAIRASLAANFGVGLDDGVIEALVQALDDALFLQNERSEAAMADALQAYRSAPFRPPTIAGQGYPANADELRIYLDGYLREVADNPRAPSTGRALISPHIDYQRGGKVYARVWHEAANMVQAADLVVIFGTDHYAGYHPITLTRQNYATPYGVLPTDIDLVDALAADLGPEQVYAGELYHRREHSIELVTIWLHHMRSGRPVPLVPILTGSFQPFLNNGHTPGAHSPFLQLISTLQHLTEGRRVLVVASGDLAHIGPAFGGLPVGIVERAALRADDDAMLAHLVAGDAEGFWRFIAGIEDRNNVCGVSPFYLTLKYVQAAEGQRAGYAMCAADGANSSVVSICGMIFG